MVFIIYGPILLDAANSTLIEIAAAFIALVLFHGLVGMLLWAYFATVFTSPGAVPPGFSPSESIANGSAMRVEDSSGGHSLLAYSIPSS